MSIVLVALAGSVIAEFVGVEAILWPLAAAQGLGVLAALLIREQCADMGQAFLPAKPGWHAPSLRRAWPDSRPSRTQGVPPWFGRQECLPRIRTVACAMARCGCS